MDRFTSLTDVAVPLQLAGMGVVGGAELAAAVARAGGLGMISGAGLSAEGIDAAYERLGEVGSRVGVNFIMPFLDRDVLDRAAARASLCEFFYDRPDAGIVDVVHDRGALASWQVGSLDEARAAQDAGCDFVVVQGVEAGGHVRGTTPLHRLLAGARAELSVPIVAGGGIGDARAAERALEAGADAVRVGTRFLAAHESDAHPDYVAALIAARAADTVLTTAFSVGWPDAPHRVLRSCVDAASGISDEVVAEISMGENRFGISRFNTVPPTTSTTGRIDAMALYAGESVENVKGRQSAAEIVAELMSLL
ncbi:MAG: NAD(P)H-dependent flavin oxidoreductase [Actinomycetota bacterium]